MLSIAVKCFPKALWILVLSNISCDALLLTVPRSSVAVTGERVELKCSSNADVQVIWGFTSFNTSTHVDIYFGDNIIQLYKSGYKIENKISGQHNLIINSIDLTHAGKYTCFEFGAENRALAYITVLDSTPECYAEIIYADKGIAASAYLWMWCRIIYTGYMTPIFRWTKVNTSGDIASNTINSDNHTSMMTTTSSVSRQLHSRDNYAIFRCKLTFQLSNNSQGYVPEYEYSWNSTENYLHAPRNISIVRNDDRLECSADGNPTPTYRWTFLETNTSMDGPVLTFDKTLNSNLECTAVNALGTQWKRFSLFNNEPLTDPLTFRRTAIALAVGGGSLLLLVVITVSYVVGRKKLKGFRPSRIQCHVSSIGRTIIDEPDIIDVDIYAYGSNALRESEDHRAVSEDLPVYTEVKKGNESLINNSCTAFSFGDDNFPSAQGPIQKKKRQNRVGADGTVYVDLSEVKQPTFKMSTARAPTPRASCETNYAFIDHTSRIPPPPPQTEF